MPDIDSLPDLALAQLTTGAPRWPTHHWLRPRLPDQGIALPDPDRVRAWSGSIRLAWIDVAWIVLWVLGLAGILIFGGWEAIPFHVMWAAELTVAPLTAAMFWVMMWHGRRRRHAASAESARVREEGERLLTIQQRFLQNAWHQLRTPITIALGHSELLSERLLLITASADPDLLQPEAVELAEFVTELVWRWRPTADRRWQLGQLDKATVAADRERIGLALDALLENAVQHTRQGDTISLSVMRADGSGGARVVVEDTGAGIAPGELAHIFDRFTTGSRDAGGRGTGLGLALVRAVADGHGGDIAASSTLGRGSRFELIFPTRSAATIENSDINHWRSSR